MKNLKATKSKKVSRYRAMSPGQFARATAKYDQENLNFEGLAVPHEMQAALDRGMKRGRGRPVKGQGAVPVQITLERGLLADADEYAQKKGMSRSELIALCLRKVIAPKKRSA
jgi:hypothetical protein